MAGGNVSDDRMKEIEAVLPLAGIGLDCDEIHARVGMWARITIKHGVRQLIDEGRAKRIGTHQHPRYLKVETT